MMTTTIRLLIIFCIAICNNTQAQCDSIPVVIDSQGGFTYSWCSEEWEDQAPTCFDLDCPLLNPCFYQTVCFTLTATSTLPYIFTMDSELSNMWTSGVNCRFMLMDSECNETFISPCFQNWNQGQEEITVDYWDGYEGETQTPWTCCAGDDWQLTVWLNQGETYNFCINPSIHPENEGEGCMTLTIFSPGLLNLTIEEQRIMKEYGVDALSARKLALIYGGFK